MVRPARPIASRSSCGGDALLATTSHVVPPSACASPTRVAASRMAALQNGIRLMVESSLTTRREGMPYDVSAALTVSSEHRVDRIDGRKAIVHLPEGGPDGPTRGPARPLPERSTVASTLRVIATQPI